MIADSRARFGADEFCLHCRVCEKACPPRAIAPTKQLVRGEVRWYVDFDKCLPYFNEHGGCGICIVACPWSLPGVADRLAEKAARRGERGAHAQPNSRQIESQHSESPPNTPDEDQ